MLQRQQTGDPIVRVFGKGTVDTRRIKDVHKYARTFSNKICHNDLCLNEKTKRDSSSAIAKTEYQKTQFDTIKLEDLGFSYPTENSITIKST